MLLALFCGLFMNLIKKSLTTRFGISVIHTFGDLAECFLLLGHRHPFEDAVVAAADTVCLVIGEVSVLRHLHIVRVQLSCDAMHN